MWGRFSLNRSCSNDLTTLAPMIRDSAPTDQNMQLLPEIFQSTSKEEAEKLWDAWYKLASESNVKEITKFAETQNENYKDGITNAGIYHIGTSVLEGINNKIKVIKRVAFGFRDFDYFFLRIMDAFRGKPAFA